MAPNIIGIFLNKVVHLTLYDLDERISSVWLKF